MVNVLFIKLCTIAVYVSVKFLVKFVPVVIFHLPTYKIVKKVANSIIKYTYRCLKQVAFEAYFDEAFLL